MDIPADGADETRTRHVDGCAYVDGSVAQRATKPSRHFACKADVTEINGVE